MKKKIMTAAFALFATAAAFAQSTTSKEEVTSKNSWLKVGLEASVPVSHTSDVSSFAGGITVAGQWMVNPHFGLGVASGYTNYFAKHDGKDLGVIPANVLLRYYPKASGWFVGADAGYSFFTNVPSGAEKGGVSLKPQIGYHNYSWNYYAFYNHVLVSDQNDVQNVGIGATYNLRFGKK